MLVSRMICDICSVVGFIPSCRRCKMRHIVVAPTINKPKRFINTRTIQLSSDSLMDACLYGDVAQWLERGKLINLRGRGFESFHLHDYIATPYSSKTRSSNIWKVGLLWHHGRVWFIANGLNPFVPQGTGGSNPPDVVSFSRRAYN